MAQKAEFTSILPEKIKRTLQKNNLYFFFLGLTKTDLKALNLIWFLKPLQWKVI